MPLKVLRELKIELKNFNPIKFTIILPLQPKIALGEINKIKLEKMKDPDFESLIDEQINNLRKQITNWIPSSEKAQSGELISINIKIEINGNTVLDQKNTDIILEEQNDEFAPGLIKNLIGLKEGDSKNLNLKISKNHPSSEMANNKANFNITVNSVKKSDSPKLDANFAKMVSNNEIKTMNSLRKKVKTSVEENHKQQSEYEYQNNAINELIKISNIELPPLMIERETQNEIEQLENLAKRFKMTLEEYLTKNNQNLDETKKNIEIETKKFAKNNNLEAEFKQSNEESEIINWIQSCMKNSYKGLLINAGAYTHTSIAIFDALKAIKIPIVEIHLSNIHKREEFRKKSFISEVADGVIFGFGSYSYILAVMAIKNLLTNKNG